MHEPPIQRIFVPNVRTGEFREAKFELLFFTHFDIEHTTSEGRYRCVYCDDPLDEKFEFRPWDRPESVFLLCRWCKPWYVATFQAMDQSWIATQFRNLSSHPRNGRHTYRKVRVEIDKETFRWLAQTLLIPFRFYYPFEIPSVDRNWVTKDTAEDVADIPYAFETIAIMPHRLNSILRRSCMALDDLIRICRLLEQPSYHGRNRDIARKVGKSESRTSEIASGRRFQELRWFDKRMLLLFRKEPGGTPRPTMWNWGFGINPDIFHTDRDEHDEQMRQASVAGAFPRRSRLGRHKSSGANDS